MKILNTARFAPSAGNQQPWRFLVIRDREKLPRKRPSLALSQTSPLLSRHLVFLRC
ncbi:MAG: nitroreductase family protein [Euryarchaeota archaeon]|nr:nitroreductase family protein [Euryarchaeota archaeon]